MNDFKKEYNLLMEMLNAFRHLGGDAAEKSFPALKCMSDECTSFSYKQDKADGILINFINELTKPESEICIEETENALFKGVVLVYYCLLKKYNDSAALLYRHIKQKAEKQGYIKVLNTLNKLKYHLAKKSICETADETDNIVVLDDENGNGVKFELLDTLVYKGKKYFVLLPVKRLYEDGEALILRLEEAESGDEDFYVSVDDEETLSAVFGVFRDRAGDRFDFFDFS